MGINYYVKYDLQHLLITNRRKLTKSAIKGATIDPILAAVEHEPKAKLLIVVGKISTV